MYFSCFLLFCNIHLVWTGSGVLNTTSKNIWTSKNSSSNFSSKKQHSVSCMSTDICRLEDKCTFACFSPTTCIHDWINTMLFQIKGAIVLGPRACQLPCAWLWLWIIAPLTDCKEWPNKTYFKKQTIVYNSSPWAAGAQTPTAVTTAVCRFDLYWTPDLFFWKFIWLEWIYQEVSVIERPASCTQTPTAHF